MQVHVLEKLSALCLHSFAIMRKETLLHLNLKVTFYLCRRNDSSKKDYLIILRNVWSAKESILLIMSQIKEGFHWILFVEMAVLWISHHHAGTLGKIQLPPPTMVAKNSIQSSYVWQFLGFGYCSSLASFSLCK